MQENLCACANSDSQAVLSTPALINLDDLGTSLIIPRLLIDLDDLGTSLIIPRLLIAVILHLQNLPPAVALATHYIYSYIIICLHTLLW